MPNQDSSQTTPDAVWLNVNPSFQHFDCDLLCNLANFHDISHWAYRQTPDEPCSLEMALTLLHNYVKSFDRPIHLMGHSTGGLLGLLYARQFPQRVKSLTLLSVGVNPAVDWQAHYFAQLEYLYCQRTLVLAQMAYALFGNQPKHALKGTIRLLERDLASSPSPHSLMQRVSICPGAVPVPLLACGGDEDAIIDPTQLQGWQPWLKPDDRLWLCPGGRHFFQTSHPHGVASEILDFWRDQEEIRVLKERQMTIPPAGLEPANLSNLV